MKKTKAAYLGYHPTNCTCTSCENNHATCDVLEFGTGNLLKRFRATSMLTAEYNADHYAAKKYLVVDYNPKTKKVSGVVDVTINDLLRNSRQSFPLYLAMKMVGRFRGKLTNIRYSVNDVGMSRITIGFLVKAKFTGK